jgi:phosphoribosyl 1,2-cyclic phosphodiesterase
MLSSGFSLIILGSGSAGNCALITTNQARLLIDAGFSARRIIRRLESCGVDPATIDGVLVTHEHNDHIAGLEAFCRRFRIPIYANFQTAEVLRSCQTPVCGGDTQLSWHLFESGLPFPLKDIEIQAFYVPHDAIDPIGFAFTSNEGSIGFMTDLGYVPKLVIERLRHVHLLVVEANHDERLLRENRVRPWALKQRIMSRHGHLSNAAAAKLVSEIAGKGLRRVILGHLSQECNRPELVLEAMERHGVGDLSLFCAEQDKPSPTFVV